jgi:hypothetical protein
MSNEIVSTNPGVPLSGMGPESRKNSTLFSPEKLKEVKSNPR